MNSQKSTVGMRSHAMLGAVDVWRWKGGMGGGSSTTRLSCPVKQIMKEIVTVFPHLVPQIIEEISKVLPYPLSQIMEEAVQVPYPVSQIMEEAVQVPYPVSQIMEETVQVPCPVPPSSRSGREELRASLVRIELGIVDGKDRRG